MINEVIDNLWAAVQAACLTAQRLEPLRKMVH